MKKAIYEQFIYNNLKRGFPEPEKALNYYLYMLKNNPESSVYPKELREFHKGLIIGLAYHSDIDIKTLELHKL